MSAPIMQAGSPVEPHFLDPLFNPRSVAVIGASGRPARPGNQALAALRVLEFTGPVYAVTPSYETIGDLVCYPEVAALPESVDLAVIAGATQRVEAHLTAAIEHGARAAVIFAEALLPDDREPKILDRIASIAREAKLPLLGPNTIGDVLHGSDRA